MSRVEKLERCVAVASFLALAGAWLLARSPSLVERLYSEGVYPRIASALSPLAALVPFSLAEGLLLTATAAVLAGLARTIQWAVRRRESRRRLLRRAAWRWAAAAGLTLATGYLFWGLNYARPEAVQRLGWGADAPLPIDDGELERLCAEVVGLTNAVGVLALRNGGGEVEGGRRVSGPELDRALDAGFAAATEALDLEPIFRSRLAPAKPIFLSGLLSRFGISGFYFPWTGEANYNAWPPELETIHAVAHEKAHQRGVASEDEANFFGFLACVHSPNAVVRYSGYLFAQRQLLRQLSRVNREEARRLAALRSDPVQRDEAEILAFWRRFQGPASRVGAAVNDSYLRLHGVAGGLQSYDRSVRLLILLARERGGLSPGPARTGRIIGPIMPIRPLRVSAEEIRPCPPVTRPPQTRCPGRSG